MGELRSCDCRYAGTRRARPGCDCSKGVGYKRSGAMRSSVIVPGQVFGRLTTVRPLNGACGNAMRWLCRCSCRNEKEVLQGDLRRGHVKSCSCLRGRGYKRNPLYKTWQNITRYPHARRWESFPRFLADVEALDPRPPGAWFRRIDAEKPWGPNNCRWRSPKMRKAPRAPRARDPLIHDPIYLRWKGIMKRRDCMREVARVRELQDRRR